jgi:hypothetical protein
MTTPDVFVVVVVVVAVVVANTWALKEERSTPSVGMAGKDWRPPCPPS